jgi:hypothetical protein
MESIFKIDYTQHILPPPSSQDKAMSVTILSKPLVLPGWLSKFDLPNRQQDVYTFFKISLILEKNLNIRIEP